MKKLKLLLQCVVYLLVFYFIFRIVSKNWSEIQTTVTHIHFGWAALSLLVITITLAFQSYNWHLLLRGSHRAIGFGQSYSSFFKSMVTRYLPGGVWVFFARVYVTAKLGLSKAQVLFLIVVESAIAVMSGCIIFLLTRPHIENGGYLTLLFVVLLGASLVFLFKPSFFLSLIKIIFKKDLAIVPLPTKTLLIVSVYSLAQWFLFGLGLHVLAIATPGAPTNQLISLIGMFAASWVMGFIIIFIPSGIGVRESFMILFLSTIMPAPIATIIALLARIISVLGELIHFILSLFVRPNTQIPPD